MSKSVQPIPPGHENLIPHLVCSPCSEAIEFYKKAFGAEEVHRMPSPDGRIMHAALRIGKSFLFLVDDFAEYCGGKSSTATALGGTPVTIHQYVTDCDAVVNKAQKAGATLLMGPHDMFWGDRYAQVQDPYGHKWSIATHVKDMTPEEMQAGMKQAFSPGSSCDEATAKAGAR